MSRRTPVVEAPMAVASDGTLLVNSVQLGPDAAFDDVVGYAKATGLPIFVGVAVPARLRGRFVREIDDALADVVGRFGPKLTVSGERASASSPAVERRSSEPSRDRPGARARRRR